MSDLLVQLALSNLLVSGVLAAVAYAVHRRGSYPGLAHLLWVFVLVKLVTPPLLAVPLAPVPGVGSAGSGATTAGASGLDATLASLAEPGVALLLFVWAAGALVVLAASLLRIYRFDRLLRRTSMQAPTGIQHEASQMAARLGLGSAPTVYTSSARLSPLTWWTGGRVRIFIPAALPGEIGIEPLRWVLAHELAHVKRRDYLVRWLEWLACVSFWWNPIAWWARRNLRFDEEASCDAMVLDRLGPKTRSYGRALLAVVEFLSGPAVRAPILATGIDARGALERRFTMIIANGRTRRTPRWLLAGLVSLAIMLMPLGVGSAADGEPIGSGPRQAVSAADAAPQDDLSPALDTDDVVQPPRDEFAAIRGQLASFVIAEDTTDPQAEVKRAVAKAKRTAKQAQRALVKAKRAAKQAQRALVQAKRAAKQAERALAQAKKAAKQLKALDDISGTDSTPPSDDVSPDDEPTFATAGDRLK